MTHYAKGANAERELLLMLFKEGYACARVAGSGSSDIPCPDLVALKNGKGFAVEAKAWNGNYLNIEVSKFEELQAWAKVSGLELLIAWKVPRKGWIFLKENQLRNTGKFYSINLEDAQNIGKTFEVLIGKQAVFKT
ncbi:MAG: Holliday junction resolvase Hjc [Candidatus Diapherotrites archaeon]|nr:Holliday junction resolvase Hjc [Candidatus Diapherotrites archaeon]